MRSRVSRAWFRVARAWLTTAVCSGDRRRRCVPRRQAQLRAAPAAARLRPVDPELEVGRRPRPGDHLAARAPGLPSRPAFDSSRPAILKPSWASLVGREGAGDRDRARQPPLLGRVRGAPRGRGLSALPSLPCCCPPLPFPPAAAGSPSAPRQQRRQGKSGRQKSKELPQNDSPLESSAESRDMGTPWHPAGFNPGSRAEIPSRRSDNGKKDVRPGDRGVTGGPLKKTGGEPAPLSVRGRAKQPRPGGRGVERRVASGGPAAPDQEEGGGGERHGEGRQTVFRKGRNRRGGSSRDGPATSDRRPSRSPGRR